MEGKLPVVGDAKAIYAVLKGVYNGQSRIGQLFFEGFGTEGINFFVLFCLTVLRKMGKFWGILPLI